MENKNSGPGEKVMFLSKVTQGLGLPDGGLEGLATAALVVRSKRTNSLDSCPLTQIFKW